MTIEHEYFGAQSPDPNSNEETDLFEFDGTGLALYSEILDEDRIVSVNGRAFTLPKGTIYAEMHFSGENSKSATLANGLMNLDSFFKALDKAKEDKDLGIPKFMYGLTNSRLARFSSRLGFVSLDGADLTKLNPKNEDEDYEIGAMVDVVRARLEHFKEKQINGEPVVDMLERRAERQKAEEEIRLNEYWGNREQELFLPTKNSGLRRSVGYAIDASVLGLALIMLPEHVRDKDLILAGMYTFNAAVFSGRIIGRIRDKKVGII